MRSSLYSTILCSGLILSGLASTISPSGMSVLHAQEETGVTSLSAEAAEKLILEKPSLIVLDVRTKEEVQSTGHLHRAESIDVFENDFDSKLKKLNLEQPVLVYCAMGGRSKRAVKKMRELGFRYVYELQGGLKAWREAGKVLEGANLKAQSN